MGKIFYSTLGNGDTPSALEAAEQLLLAKA
jgi:hypothetical protein